MLRFNIIKDEAGHELYVETHYWGARLLNVPKLNKGTAFTEAERDIFHLRGKLPNRVETLDDQVKRYHEQFLRQHGDLGKHIFLTALHDTNEILFFKLISNHLEEMLPIIYTPTVGLAVETFSLEMRRPRGIYISYPDRDRMDEILDNRLNLNVDLILATDGEGVLGIGDQGVGGMYISIAKLIVYILCGGINPNRVLPIQLDVGTNNQKLLNDPMYLGWRHSRISGQQYDEFIKLFVDAVKRKFPEVFLHWEDFGRENARRNLETYRQTICSFNDDMQGTAVVALACVLAGIKAAKGKFEDQRIIIFGAGTAGCGIADQICDAYKRLTNIDEKQARQHLWLIDRNGLLLENSANIQNFQKPYARLSTEIRDWQITNKDYISLADVVKNVKPTVLIGCSTVHGAFTEDIIREMATHIEHPVILPLSNPTHLAEAEPDDLYHWTNGKALIACGSPFAPILFNGKTYRISQSNNAFAFPGIGLGVLACKAKYVTDNMLWAACQTLAACSPAKNDPFEPLLPHIEDARKISKKIALAVAEQAFKDGVATTDPNIDLKQQIKTMMWKPKYLPYKKITIEEYKL